MEEEMILYWAKQLEGKELSVNQLFENAKWLIDKIKTQLSPDAEWHKYPEKKPEYGKDVLIYTKQKWMEVGFLCKGVDDFWSCGSIETLSIRQEDIIYWREQPLPPVED